MIREHRRFVLVTAISAGILLALIESAARLYR